MPEKQICAYYKSEERYARLTLTYYNEKQLKNIEKVVSAITKEYDSSQLNIYTQRLTEGKSGYNIEYNDDYDKMAGRVFDEIMIELKINHCK